ncbi:MAG: AMP-binding protein, partial [Planctomycetota bacterium]
MNESSEPLGWRDVASAGKARAEHVAPSGQCEPLPEGALEQSVPERFERVVARHAERLAIKDGDQTLTYSALNQAANRLAHAILAERGEGEEPVVLVLEHGL